MEFGVWGCFLFSEGRAMVSFFWGIKVQDLRVRVRV